MAEYIDREAFKKEYLCCGYLPEMSETEFDTFPAADVAPVRHGEWEKKSGLYSCSECGMTCPYDVQADVIEYWACNYCPNCGCRMGGGDDE